jgi:hypothetical protein
MVMAPPPGCGHRIRAVHHERITTGAAERPGRRQASRASADHHDMLNHNASV